MTKITPDRLANLDAEPQPNRSIIRCMTCRGSFVATAWDSKVREAIQQLDLGKHEGHEFASITIDEFYTNFASTATKHEGETRALFDRVVAVNGGIFIY